MKDKEWSRLTAPELGLSSASLHEACGKIGALPSSIKPLSTQVRLCGSAFPVRCPAGDNLFLHHAIYAAKPGDVLVVDAGADPEFGHWGEIMATAAQLRGIAGLVTTGGVRDTQKLVTMNFPVFAEYVSIRGTGKDPCGAGGISDPVTLGDVTINAGDFIFGDADGVVVLPAGEVDSAIEKSQARDREEVEIVKRLTAGETTLSIYGLPNLASERRPVATLRRSVDVAGLSHGALPIPVASRIGLLIATGGIRGLDASTGSMPGDITEQVELMFGNLRLSIEAAGAGVQDILKVTIWVGTPEVRLALNAPWTKLFPDRASRPARHVLNYEFPPGMFVQCEALAVAT
jgi:4-hydroxy-4-methyl-2-oxoglutarate aldolase